MATSTAGRMLLGFIAAGIAVVTFHDGMILALTKAGVIPGTPWSMAPVAPWGVPKTVNNIFWGGLWGALFALLYNWLPGGSAWLKGLIYGAFIVLVSNWTLLPLVRSKVFQQAAQPLFGGGDPKRMMVTLAILMSFGLGLGLIYRAMARR